MFTVPLMYTVSSLSRGYPTDGHLLASSVL